MKQTNHTDVKAGKILLSEPFMVDANFRRTAILLCDHREEGTVGFIINRPIDMKIGQLVADFPDIEAEVYYGGPVATDTIHYIHTKGDIVDNSIPVTRGVFWGGDFDKLKFLIESKMIHSSDIRFFVGYAGWDAGQLADEMEVGTWILTGMHANYLFKSKPQSLWREITNNIGSSYSVIAQMPDPVCLN